MLVVFVYEGEYRGKETVACLKIQLVLIWAKKYVFSQSSYV